jgi:hypothetical protein
MRLTMSNTKIISKKIRLLTPRDKEYLHSLPVRGLYVVVRPDGSKPYAYRYTSPITGKRRLYLTDIEGADKYDLAVDEAAALKRIVKREHKDPLDESRKKQEQELGDYVQGRAED